MSSIEKRRRTLFKKLWNDLQRDPTWRIDSIADSEAKKIEKSKDLFCKMCSRAEEEFAILSRMHEIIPENVPNPMGVIRNGYGHGVGYFMERIEGETLTTLFNKDKFTGGVLDSITELIEIIEKLHKNNMAHGDLHSGNIIVTHNSRVMLIDPATWCYSDNSERIEAMKRDSKALRAFRALLKANSRLK